MEKLNPVRRRFPLNKFPQENEKLNICKNVSVVKLELFSWKEDANCKFSLFFFPFTFFSSSVLILIIRSTCALHNNVCQRKIFAQKFKEVGHRFHSTHVQKKSWGDGCIKKCPFNGNSAFIV